MKKNIVFIVDIKLKGTQQEVGRWAEPEVVLISFL